VGALADEVDAQAQIDELRAALQREQRKAAKAKNKTADLIQAVYDGSKDAMLAVGRHPIIPRPARDRRRSPEIALLHLSDWQLGKITDSYNPDVCEERVRMAIARTLKIAEIQRADHPVRDCAVLLGGDLVEGVGIFPGQEWEIDSGAFEQVMRVVALVEQAIISLLDGFEHVEVWEVAGNHGRIGKKGQHPRKDNWDHIAGAIARMKLENQPRLTWHEPDKWYEVVTAGEYKALLVHGDQIKNFGGNTPVFGILRKSTGWSSGAIREEFTDVYMGHFHTPMSLTMPNGAMIRVVGSPESDNEYAREFVAARGWPSQRLVFIDPKRGRITADYTLWLDE